MEDYGKIFTTERLIMEPWDPRDKETNDFLYGTLYRNPAVEAYATGDMLSPRTRSAIDDPVWVGRLESNPFKAIICLKPDNWAEIANKPALGFRGTPIGFIGMWGIELKQMQHQSASMGLSLAPEYQGKGYGTEAVKFMVDWAFRHGNFHSLRLQALATNAKGIEAYKKAGFVLEGTIREACWDNGKWEDLVCMGVLRSEWEETRPDKKST